MLVKIKKREIVAHHYKKDVFSGNKKEVAESRERR